MRLRASILSLSAAILSSFVILFSMAATQPVFSEKDLGQGIHKVVRFKLKNFKTDIAYIHDSGFDIAGVNLDAGTVDLVLSGNEFKAIQAMMPLEIVHTKAVSLSVAPDEEYLNYDELSAKLNALANQYSNIMRLEEVGKSIEGRPILAVKLTDNVGEREATEPVVFFNAMHHAREVMTTEVAFDTIEYLTANYGTDADVTRWLDSTEIWLMPMVNPDGNHKVWHDNNMWRKNTRDGFGVDINRNYPYKWGKCGGSSGATSNETYRGAAAGSEPETQALMNLVAKIKPALSIAYHSFSELVLYPYGCQNMRTVNRGVVEGFGKKIASVLTSDADPSRGYKAGTSWDILYSVDGGDIDWMHEVHQVIPYVIELNGEAQGFQPSYKDWRNKTTLKARKAWMLMLNRVHQSGVHGVISQIGAPVAGAKVVVSSRELPELLAITYTSNLDGSFHVVLDPGTYTVKVTHPATAAVKTTTVTVGPDLVPLEINM